MDDRHEMIRKYGLHGLPANGSSAEYAEKLNDWLERQYTHCQPFSKQFVSRALRKLGFLHVGRNRDGDNLLHNPHHDSGII